LDLLGHHDALPLLLQPGLSCGGWPHVTVLKVRASKEKRSSLPGGTLSQLQRPVHSQ
jgi:hypothetical protein